MDTLRFLSREQIISIRENFETPVFVYSERRIREQAEKVLAFPHAFGFTPRYAMKTNSNGTILRLFDSLGIGIDASSGYEVHRALHAGISPDRIQLTGQEIPRDLHELVERGIEFNATSLHQLTVYGELFPHTHTSIRVNPGLGSGGTNRTNVG
jgi:diaminopimelate decarboxylase